MAARRTSRRTKDGSPSLSSQPPATSSPAPKDKSVTPDVCPACPVDREEPRKKKKKEIWVSCEGCQTWYHWECVSEGVDLATIDKWYCPTCIKSDPSLTITHKPPARKSSRTKTKQDYANMNAGLPSDPNRWIKVLKAKKFAKDNFKRMKGAELTAYWVASDETALTEPVIIPDMEGLGMTMPGDEFTVDDVAALVGPNTPVEVIDVASQSNSPGWTLQSWVEYYNKPASQRDKIRNVISLEVTDTKLSSKVTAPRIVKQLDWVHQIWPANRKGKGQFPKVGLYCLMSVAQCWTDWHVDFAGSSVYYHVLKGAKDFYFFRPTDANLAAYEKWSGSEELQGGTWLGDMVDTVYKVSLVEGNTMIIPTGWVHAVYTPVDSLVFGGNFLHSYNIATQLRIRQIEINTKVPKKFRFPLFQRMCWYVADYYVQQFKAKTDIPPRILRGLAALADFLVAEANLLEAGGDPGARRDAKEQVPTEKVKDPAELAKEFKRRVRLARGESSDEEDEIVAPLRKKPANGKGKRKRVLDESEDEDVKPRIAKRSKFRNWEPPVWDEQAERDLEDKKETLAAEPSGDWVLKAGALDSLGTQGPEGVEHISGGKEWLRIRKVTGEDGRQRVERVRITKVVESWSWGVERPGEREETMVDSDVKMDGPGPPVDASDGDVEMKDDAHEEETDGTVEVPLIVTEAKGEDTGASMSGGVAVDAMVTA